MGLTFASLLLGQDLYGLCDCQHCMGTAQAAALGHLPATMNRFIVFPPSPPSIPCSLYGLEKFVLLPEKHLLRGTSLKTTCRVKPGPPEFHLQSRRRGHCSGLRAEGVTVSPGSWRGSRAPISVLGRCLTGLTPSLIEKQCQEQIIMPEARTVRLKGGGITRQLTGAQLTEKSVVVGLFWKLWTSWFTLGRVLVQQMAKE